MKRLTIPVLIIIMFLTGISIVVYPVISNKLYEQNQSYVMAEYDETIDNMEQELLDEELRAAKEYNSSLLENEAFLSDPFDPDLSLNPTVEPYASLLNVDGDGIMGYVEAPKISVNLPIYHGTTAEVLKQGIGHLQNSSLPVGGSNTHTVLTGHTGMSGKRLFTDLSQLEIGDVFYLHVLGETLAYQVENIYIVQPDETENLLIQNGKDLATLVTCHPYGINTHRLLVQGSRIPYEEAIAIQSEDEEVATESVWKIEYQKAMIICLLIYIPLTLIIVLLVLRKMKRRRKKRKLANNRKIQ